MNRVEVTASIMVQKNAEGVLAFTWNGTGTLFSVSGELMPEFEGYRNSGVLPWPVEIIGEDLRYGQKARFVLYRRLDL